MTKPLHVGHCAGNFDATRVLADWAAPLDILAPGIAIRQYPCCASTHPAFDVMIDLVTAHDLLPEMVDHVDCWTHPRRIREITGRIHAAPHPRMEMASTEHFGSEIRLHLKDGRVISGTTDRPLGRGPTKPLPIHRLEGKFLDCAGQAVAAEAVAHAMRVIWSFDTLNDPGSLGSMFSDGAFNISTQ